MSINQIYLMGRLGKEVLLSYTQSAVAVSKMSLATSEEWRDKDGKKHEKTEWHSIVVFGKTAENCATYLSKGSKVFISGKLTHRSYEAKDGTTKHVSEIVASSVQFLDALDKKENKTTKDQDAKAIDKDWQPKFEASFTTEDIPF